MIIANAVGIVLNGFILEIADDGIARTVTAVLGDQITFTPSLTAASTAGVRVDNWGAGATDLEVDLYLQSGSPCIDAANGDVAPEFDLDGNDRWDDPSVDPDTGVGTPTYVDMGAYEYSL